MNEKTDTPETLAAILAEMRGNEFDDPHLDADGIIGARRLARDWADRIEAAAERERDEDRQLAAIAESDEAFARCARCDRPERATGNVAAMRDVLNSIADIAEDAFGGPWRHREASQGHALSLIIDAAKNALAAPARNCDRFATAEEAVAAFADHLRAWENAHGICSDNPDHPVQVPVGAFAWLFAPAEGGAE